MEAPFLGSKSRGGDQFSVVRRSKASAYRMFGSSKTNEFGTGEREGSCNEDTAHTLEAICEGAGIAV